MEKQEERNFPKKIMKNVNKEYGRKCCLLFTCHQFFTIFLRQLFLSFLRWKFAAAIRSHSPGKMKLISTEGKQQQQQ